MDEENKKNINGKKEVKDLGDEKDLNEQDAMFTADFKKEENIKDLTSIKSRNKKEVQERYKNYYNKLASEKTLLSEKNKIIDELKKYADKETEKLNQQIKDIKNNAKETKEKLENKIDDSKLKIIETLGIFVALFTFISIEFQVFRSYESAMAIAGLTLVILGSLTFFVTILDFVLNVNLSFLKIKKDSGLIASMMRDAQAFTGIEEVIDFCWSKPSTWGQAVKTKTLPLIGLSILFIFFGILLFVKSPEPHNLNNSISELKNKNNSMELKVQEIERKGIILNDLIKNDTIKNSEKEKLQNEINNLQSVVDCLRIKGYFSNKCF